MENTLSIDALSRRMRTPLRRYFQRRIGEQHQSDVEDLVQEVFMRFSTEADLTKSIGQIEPYLFKTAKNLLQDYRRNRSSRRLDAHESYEETLHGLAAEVLDAERQALGHEALERLFAALYGLPGRTRSVWVQYHLEDLSHAEISQKLGIAQSTIEKHMARATLHLLNAVDLFL